LNCAPCAALQRTLTLLQAHFGDLFDDMSPQTLFNWGKIMKAAEEKHEDPEAALSKRKPNRLAGTCILPPALLEKIKVDLMALIDEGVQVR
jgi:hypothetical protein